MSSYVTAELRRLVRARAQKLCEYCLIHEDDTYAGCHLDHIISEKHGGLTVFENLAYACPFCNQSKGTDIGSILLHSKELTRFFNPRIDKWSDHFSLVDLRIVPTSAIGEVTERILDFNHHERIAECEILFAIGSYPREAARRIINGQS